MLIGNKGAVAMVNRKLSRGSLFLLILASCSSPISPPIPQLTQTLQSLQMSWATI